LKTIRDSDGPEKAQKNGKRKLDEDEARNILEELARNRLGPASARVAAIRVLLRLDREERELEEARSSTGNSAFDALYDVS
jgi:hypothetical protein